MSSSTRLEWPSGLVTCGLVAGLLLGAADGLLGVAVGPATAALTLAPLLVAGAGVALGVIATMALALGAALARALERLRVPPGLTAGLTAAGVAAAASHPLVVALLSGRAARLHPLRGAALIVLPLLAATAAFLLVQLGRGLVARLAARQGNHPPALWVAAVLVVLSAALLLADRRLFVRRYEPLHGALQLMALMTAFGAVALAAAGTWRARAAWSRLRLRLLGGLTALATTAACVLVAVAAQGPERGPLRAALFEQTRLGARVMDGARLVAPRETAPVPGVAPRRTQRTATTASLTGPPYSGADVIVITVDALRADRLGLYGHSRATSPALDRLAAESIAFERAYAPTPHTSFSLTSLLTGRHAFSLARLGKLGDRPTLADAFTAAEYRTIGLFPPAVFFSEGDKFASYESRRFGFEITRYENLPETTDAPVRTDQAIALLDAHREEPVFLWAHYFGPHEPYLHHPELGPPAPFGVRDIDRYDEEILWVDREIGRLLDHVRATRPGAIVIVSADHGEEFGEHGGAYHGTTLFDEQLRIPVLVRLPGTPPRRIAGAVSTVDVAATLTALVGLPWATPLEGNDLSAWMLGSAGDGALPPVFAEIDPVKMIALGSRKLICDITRDFCRLHDTAIDPGERRDLSAQHRREAAGLRAELEAWLRRPVDPPAAGPAPPLLGPVQRDVLLAAAARGERRSVARVGILLRPTGRGGTLAPVDERREAAQLLARLATPRHRATLQKARTSDPDSDVRAWSTVALAGMGDKRALEAVKNWPTPLDPALAAHRALALVATKQREGASALLSALEAVSEIPLRCRLFRALATTRDERAFATLERAYEQVRTRRCVVPAFGELRTGAALSFLTARLEDEPYTTVRADVARAIGVAGARDAIPALTRAFRADREEQVVAAAARALADLGAALPVRGGRRVRPPSDAREMWVVAPRAKGAPLRVTLIGGDKRLLAASIDTAVSRDAYPLALPAEGSALVQVAAPARFALFR